MNEREPVKPAGWVDDGGTVFWHGGKPPADDTDLYTTPPTSATVEAATITLVRETLQGIVSADWRKWEELADPLEFERWAKSRANHALQALASQPAQQAEPLPLSFAEDWQGEAPRTDALHRKLVKLSENPRTWVAGKDYVEMREHAETLERELQAANDRADSERRLADHARGRVTELAKEIDDLRAQLAAQAQTGGEND